MRSARIRNVLAVSAPALLMAVVGAGCSGDESSSRHDLPGRPQAVATIVGDGLVPGDGRAPDPTSVPTTAPPRPIGRPVIPVPAHAPVTRRPVELPVVVTTTSTAQAATATAVPGG
jgi:hypothetical protein